MADVSDLGSRRDAGGPPGIAGMVRSDARADRYLRDTRAVAAAQARAMLGTFPATRRSLADLRLAIVSAMERAGYDEGDAALLAGVDLERAKAFLAGSDLTDAYDALRLAIVTGATINGR